MARSPGMSCILRIVSSWTKLLYGMFLAMWSMLHEQRSIASCVWPLVAMQPIT